MYIIHWQGNEIVKCEPQEASTPVRPGRHTELVEDDDPRISEWRARVAAESSARSVGLDARKQREEAHVNSLADLRAFRDGSGKLTTAQALRVLIREVLGDDDRGKG